MRPQYRVILSDKFVETATLAAIESYAHGTGRKGTEREEIHGLIWGNRRKTENGAVLLLDRLAIHLASKRRKDSVTPIPKALQDMAHVMSRFAPDQLLLGDFHTHPYGSLTEVDQEKGYEFSTTDFKSFRNDDPLWEESDGNPVMVATTICPLEKVHTSPPKSVRSNVVSFSVFEYRLWFNVSVGDIDEDQNRSVSGNTHSNVWLDLDSKYWNISGDRLSRES